MSLTNKETIYVCENFRVTTKEIKRGKFVNFTISLSFD